MGHGLNSMGFREIRIEFGRKPRDRKGVNIAWNPTWFRMLTCMVWDISARTIAKDVAW